jgi:hypothetical protein
MRYAYDTEFLEDGRTIELISIGVVREDGQDYYAVNADAPWRRIAKHDWLCENVVRHLPRIHGDPRNHVSMRRNPCVIDFDHPTVKPHPQIRDELAAFFAADPTTDVDSTVELWADYGAYDHVALMQLFGPMIDKPPMLPMFTCDLQQVLRAVIPAQPLPDPPDDAHNALADAWHLMRTLHAVFGTEPPGGQR